MDTRDESEGDTLEAAGRLLELRAAGLDDFVANGVMVAEVALIAVHVSDADAVGAVGPHLATSWSSHVYSMPYESTDRGRARAPLGRARRRLHRADAKPCTELARLCPEAA